MSSVAPHKLSAQELKDLEDLIGHPGWHLVELMVDQEWGAAGFGQKVAATVGKMAADPDNLPQLTLAAQHLAQATVTQTEVLRIMKWPRAVLNEAKGLARGQLASMNRGGL